MFARALLLFLCVTVLEVLIFLKVSAWLGLLNTVALLLLLGVLGVTILRHEGFRVLLELQRNLAGGLPPAPKLVEGVLLAATGLLLITPGFLTDLAGLIILLPPARRRLSRVMVRRFRRWMTPPGGPIIIDL